MHKSKSKFCNIARKWWVIFCTGKCTESCVFVWTPWNTQLLVFFFASFTCVSHCTSLSQLDLRWVSFESQKKAHVTERKKMNPNAFISMLHFKFSSLVLLSNFWGVDWAKEAIFWHATVSSGFFSLVTLRQETGWSVGASDFPEIASTGLPLTGGRLVSWVKLCFNWFAVDSDKVLQCLYEF